jgi:predicted S18 family serine protease
MQQYIAPSISALILIAYIFIAIKQGKYINILKETNDQIKSITSVQSGLISDFKAYRELFNMDDIAKLVQLKLDNQELMLSKKFADREKAVVQEYIDTSSEHVKTISELSEKVKYYESSSTEMGKKLKLIEEQQKLELLHLSEEFEEARNRVMENLPLLAEKIRELKQDSKD